MIQSLAFIPLVAFSVVSVVSVVSGASPVASVQASSLAVADPAPLGTQLHYRLVDWHGTSSDPDGSFSGVSVEVPASWNFSLTAEKQGRFNDPTRTWLLTVQWPERPQPARVAIRRQVRSLRGTSGLRILERGIVDSDHDTESRGVLVYRYVDDSGQPRWVGYRYATSVDGAGSIISVAGRPQDSVGLDDVLHHAVHTVGESG